MRHNLFAMMFVATGAMLTSLGHQAEAQVIPVKASGQDAYFNPVTGQYGGEGVGTRLGKHSFTGTILYAGDFFPEPGVFFEGTFTGTQTTTAANGDTLEMELSGDVLLVFEPSGLVSGVWYPNFVVVGGTGQFESVTGSFSGPAINPPFDPTLTEWPFDWFYAGEIDLGKKK